MAGGAWAMARVVDACQTIESGGRTLPRLPVSSPSQLPHLQGCLWVQKYLWLLNTNRGMVHTKLVMP